MKNKQVFNLSDDMNLNKKNNVAYDKKVKKLLIESFVFGDILCSNIY